MDDEEREVLNWTAADLEERRKHTKRAKVKRSPFNWLDLLAIHRLGRRHGWPVRAGREFLFEPDEPLQKIQRAWDASGGTGFTTNPPAIRGIYMSPSSDRIIFKDNRIEGP